MGSKVRKSNIEILRIISMIMIICLHILGHGGVLGESTPNSINYIGFETIEIFSYVSVNVYVLISGYFLIQSKFSLKKLLYIILEVLFYTVGFYFLFVATGQISFSLKGLALALFPFKEYWFVRIYIGLYCLAPVINYMLLKLNKREWQTTIAVELALFSLLLPSMLFDINGGGIVWFVTLYTIAGYIRIHGMPKKSAKNYFFGYIATMGICTILVLSTKLVGISEGIWLRYNGAFVLGGSVFLFLCFLQLPSINGKMCSVINTIAGCTFGVYLLHENSYMRQFLWSELLKTTQYANLPFGIGIILVIVLGVFIVCSLVDWVRQILFIPLLHSRAFSNIDVHATTFIKKIETKFIEKESN